MLNGWQRLYCVLAVVAVLPALALWGLSKPKWDGAYPAWNCYELSGGARYTAQEARVLIESYEGEVLSDHLKLRPETWPPRTDGKPYLFSDCAQDLTEISTGLAAKKAHAAWWNNFLIGGTFYLVAFILLYGLGWSLRWIWRGFFPSPGR
jgi:hypothetical protein